MRKFYLHFTWMALMFLATGLQAQQFNQLSSNRCISSAGDSVMLYFGNVPTPAGGGTITFRFNGDLDGTGTNREVFDFYSENGGLLTSSFSISQCGYDSVSVNVPIDSLINWTADGVIFFIAQSTSNVGPTVCPQGACVDTRLQYPFVIVNNDIAVSRLVSPTNFCSGNQNITVEIMNSGINQVASGTVNWSFDGVVQTPVNFNTLLDTVGGSGNSSTQIVLGNKNFAPQVRHDLVVWTSNPNGVTDGNPANDTLVVNRLQPSLSGTFSIGGSGANYGTVDSAIFDLNRLGVCGPVVFNIAKDTFNGNYAIGNIKGASSTNTITFQSASGNPQDVLLAYSSLSSSDNYVVALRGASHLIFRNLTMINSGFSYGQNIAIENGATNITIEGCTLVGNFRGSSSSNYANIYNDGSQLMDVTIRNCTLLGGSVGAYINGSFGSLHNNLIIEGNIIEPYYQGMRVEYAENSQIHGNKVTSNTFANYTSFYGMYLDELSVGSEVTANTINNREGRYGIYFSGAQGDSMNRILVANNMIHIGGSSTCYGIYMSGSCSNMDVFHNSVNLTNTGSTSRTLYYSGSGSGNKVINNVFANQENGLTLYINDPDDFDTIDYNLLYSNGSDLVSMNFIEYGSLADYQQNTGFDINGYSFAPPFASDSNLHVAPTLYNTGTGLPEVIVDIDGDPRDPNKPTIGADEVTPGPVDMATVGLVNPTSGCGLSSAEQVTVILRSFGLNTVPVGTNIDVSFAIPGQATVTETITTVQSMDFGDSLIYTFNNTADLMAGGTYDITVSVAIAGDGEPSNDDLTFEVTNNTVTALPAVTNIEGWGPLTSDPSCNASGVIAQDGWEQDEEDGGNWNAYQGPTPNINTGPVRDFAPGTQTGTYLYVDGSYPCYLDNEEVSLISPCIDLTNLNRPGLNFAYHMYGDDMGELHVDVINGTLVIPDVWVVSGDQGNQWRQASVDFSQFKNFGDVRIRIRAVIGSGSQTDIAIDDLRLGNLPNVNLGTAINDCGYVVLDAKVPDATYRWSTGDTTQSITVINSGNSTLVKSYAVMVEKNGMYNIDSVDLTLEPGPYVDLGPDPLVVCESDSVILDAGNPGMKHTWENGFFGQTKLVTQAGTYWVSVDNLKGCVKSDTVEVAFKDIPTASFTHANVSSLSRLEFTFTGDGNPNFLWDFGDGNGSTIADPTHLYASGGSYTVTLIAYNECGADTISQQVNVWATGVEDPEEVISCTLSPNPSHGPVRLRVATQDVTAWQLTVTDVAGRRVHHRVLQPADEVRYQFDVQDWAKGLYLVRLQSESGDVLRKMVVQ